MIRGVVRAAHPFHCLSPRFSNIGKKKPQQNQRVKQQQQRGQSKPKVRAQPQVRSARPIDMHRAAHPRLRISGSMRRCPQNTTYAYG